MSYRAVGRVERRRRWIDGADFVILPVCRAGPHTSDEYLGARFGLAARATSEFVQVQCRPLVTGMILTPTYLVLSC